MGLLAGIAASSAAALRFTDDSCFEVGIIRVCPEGVVGTSYSKQLNGAAGCEPHHAYRVSNGALPPGLSLSSNGLISGTPAQSGNYLFEVELRDVGPAEGGPDWCSNPKLAHREFTLNVLSGLSIETKSLQDKPASIGVAYSAPLNAMLLTALNPPAGTAATGVTWSVISGALPPGLSIVSGVITGTPTTAGSFTFVVQAELDPTRRDTETLQIDVTAALAITAPAKPRSEVGVAFAAKLVATGGTGVYTWSLGGGALPAGVALAADGTLAGTPTAAGAFSFTAALADSAGRTTTQTVAFSVAARLAISTQRLRAGKVGRLYRAKLTATGGVLPKKWKVKTGPLPRGIRFDRTLGLLSGTPTRPGRYRVTFEATDALKVTSKKTLLIEVLA